jgi:hypothetical protein
MLGPAWRTAGHAFLGGRREREVGPMMTWLHQIAGKCANEVLLFRYRRYIRMFLLIPMRQVTIQLPRMNFLNLQTCICDISNICIELHWSDKIIWRWSKHYILYYELDYNNSTIPSAQHASTWPSSCPSTISVLHTCTQIQSRDMLHVHSHND